MSKYIGFVVAFAFFASWLWKKLRPAKISEVKSIPTGVSRWSYLIVTLMIFVGGILLPFGVSNLVTQVQYNIDWVPSTGFVTELVPDGTNRGRTTYRARFHYQTSQETGSVDHEVLDPDRSQNPPRVAEGVNVLYDPSNPDNAIIDSFRTRWWLPIVMLVIGAATLTYAISSIVVIVRLQSMARLARGGIGVGQGEGKLIKVSKNFLLSLRHKPCWSLVVEYTDLLNKKHIVKSEPIWDFHPDTWARDTVPVPLTIDRANPARAWVRVQEYFKLCQQTPR